MTVIEGIELTEEQHKGAWVEYGGQGVGRMRIQLFVPGYSKTAGSKKAFRHPQTGKIIIMHDNPKTKVWMDTVKWFAMKQVGRMVLLSGAVCLKLTFLFERPKCHYGSGRNEGTLKTSSPLHDTAKTHDLTKLTRAVEDALTGIVWKDDSQVIGQRTNKRYCRGEEKPGVHILIETVDTKGVSDYGKEKKQGRLFV